MTSYKAGMRFSGQAEPSFNAQVFATKQEAEIAANELMSRWILPIGFEVIQVNEEVNYRIDNGRPVRIDQS